MKWLKYPIEFLHTVLYCCLAGIRYTKHFIHSHNNEYLTLVNTYERRQRDVEQVMLLIVMCH